MEFCSADGMSNRIEGDKKRSKKKLMRKCLVAIPKVFSAPWPARPPCLMPANQTSLFSQAGYKPIKLPPPPHTSHPTTTTHDTFIFRWETRKSCGGGGRAACFFRPPLLLHSPTTRRKIETDRPDVAPFIFFFLSKIELYFNRKFNRN